MKSIIFLLLLIVMPIRALAITKEAVQTKLGVELKELNPTPIKGIYEIVTVINRIYYVDETGRFLIDGSIFDVDRKASITQERMEEVTKIDFETLPFDQAIVEGSGEKRIAVFHDPDCPYCRRLYGELKKIKGVKIYNFVFNLPSHPKAYDKAKKVYCAKNGLGALDKAMAGNEMEDFPICETDKVEKNKKLSELVGVTGTPHMILENGVSLQGFRTAEEVMSKIEKVKLKK